VTWRRLALVVVAYALWAWPVEAQVTRCNSPAIATNNAFEDFVDLSIDASCGTLLGAYAYTNDTSGTIVVSSCTFNTTETLTELVTTTSGTTFRLAGFYYRKNPTSTTATLHCLWNAVAAASGRYYVRAFVLSVADVAGTTFGTPSCVVGASGTSKDPASVTTTDANGLFLTAIATDGGTTSITAAGSGHSIIGTMTSGSGINVAAGDRAGSSSGVTPGWTWTGTSEHSVCVVPINAMGGGGGGTPGCRQLTLVGVGGRCTE
jgi:hypothetical protein